MEDLMEDRVGDGSVEYGMGKANVVKVKSYAFAVRIVKMVQLLSREQKEYVLSRQVLRSGTSIGANVEEAVGA